MKNGDHLGRAVVGDERREPHNGRGEMRWGRRGWGEEASKWNS
jgi:hypothetical protein